MSDGSRSAVNGVGTKIMISVGSLRRSKFDVGLQSRGCRILDRSSRDVTDVTFPRD